MFGSERVLTDEVGFERQNDVFRCSGPSKECRFAYSLDAVVGCDADHHPVDGDEGFYFFYLHVWWLLVWFALPLWIPAFVGMTGTLTAFRG